MRRAHLTYISVENESNVPQISSMVDIQDYRSYSLVLCSTKWHSFRQSTVGLGSYGGLPFFKNTAGGFDLVPIFTGLLIALLHGGTAPYHLQMRLFNNAMVEELEADSSNNQHGQNLSCF